MSQFSNSTYHIEDALPSELFHYTDQNGLLGIISSQSFWTTKITCLNDSSEYFLAFEIAKSLLEELAKFSDYDTVKVHFLLDEMRGSQYNRYVGSFSEAGDLLSQWRAYGSSTSGYALGLNSRKLNEILDQQGFYLSKCIYDPVKQKEIITALIIKQLEKGYFPEPETYGVIAGTRTYAIPAMSNFWHELTSIAPLIKDTGFQEEQEWRLVSKDAILYDKVEFRKGISYLIPYFPLTLSPLPNLLSSIIVGPSPHPQISEETLRMLLSKQGLSKTKIVHSKIPFRYW